MALKWITNKSKLGDPPSPTPQPQTSNRLSILRLCWSGLFEIFEWTTQYPPEWVTSTNGQTGRKSSTKKAIGNHSDKKQTKISVSLNKTDRYDLATSMTIDVGAKMKISSIQKPRSSDRRTKKQAWSAVVLQLNYLNELLTNSTKLARENSCSQPPSWRIFATL
jgi:hypothetical protein